MTTQESIGAAILSQHSSPEKSLPAFGYTEDGVLYLAWTRGEWHLEIEVLKDGRIEWFTMNGDTWDGSDEPEDGVSEQLARCMKTIPSVQWKGA